MEVKVIAIRQEVKELFKELNKIHETVIIGRSLVSDESKDVDFAFIGISINESAYVRRKLSGIIGLEIVNSTHRTENYDIGSFDLLIKARYRSINIDILFTKITDSVELISQFSLTCQHIAYTKQGYVYSKEYSGNILELSDNKDNKKTRKQKNLKKCMKKYIKYYPCRRQGHKFKEKLYEFAFVE